MKPLVLAIALALSAPLPAFAQTTAQAAAPVAQAKSTAAPAWVETSNRNAQILLAAQAPFQPEYASFFGIPGYDDQVADLGPDNSKRYRDATAKARAELQTQL